MHGSAGTGATGTMGPGLKREVKFPTVCWGFGRQSPA